MFMFRYVTVVSWYCQALMAPRKTTKPPPMPAPSARRGGAVGLERNIVAISAATFLLSLGENLWKRFLPKYLEALGAPVTAIGLFGTCQDFLDGVYQYPGG